MASNNTPSPLVWFMLLESYTGKSYKGTTTDKVAVFSHADVADFRNAVIKKYKDEDSSILTGLASSQLLVYKNKTTFGKRNAAVGDGTEEPLKSSHTLVSLGETEEDALIVVVPISTEIQIGKSRLLQ